MNHVSFQNKENCGLVERLTSLASTHSQTVDKLQGLEIQMEKLTNQKAALESREKKVKEDAGLVSFEVNVNVISGLLLRCSFNACFVYVSGRCTASKGDRYTKP